jgi:heme/copper-type cytochrome/quinol oxidase subunit 2
MYEGNLTLETTVIATVFIIMGLLFYIVLKYVTKNRSR